MFPRLHPIVLTGGAALLVGLSLFQPFSPGTVRAGDLREATPIAADLVTAIRNADAQVVRKLIEDGADVNARDADGNTPLIVASFYASPQCVALLLEKGADVDAANEVGVTALVRAATNYEKARLLVDAGAKGPGANGRSRQHAADPGRPPRRQCPDRQIAAFPHCCPRCHPERRRIRGGGHRSRAQREEPIDRLRVWQGA